MSKTNTEPPLPVEHFSYTFRIQAVNAALAKGLHLVRDNHNLWGIQITPEGKYIHRFICFHASYDTLWRQAIEVLRQSDFDPNNLPYRVGENKADSPVTIYNPVTRETATLSRTDCRTRIKAPKPAAAAS